MSRRRDGSARLRQETACARSERIPLRLNPLLIVALAVVPALAGCAAPDESLAASSVAALAPRFAVTALVPPAEGGEVGVPMTVVATVANEGSLAGSATLRLFVGSALGASEPVDVAAGATKDVSLTFTPSRGGDLVLEAVVDGAPGMRAEVPVRAPRIEDVRFRHAPEGCTGNVSVEAWFTNAGDAVAKALRLSVSIVDGQGRTWDSETVEVGDLAVGAEGTGLVKLTAYDRCNVPDEYRLQIRVRPANGETAAVTTDRFYL